MTGLGPIGFGCWTIGGEHWGEVRDEDSIAAVRAAYEGGVRLFDTAPLYGRGHADEVLVRALGERRHEALIATKVGVRMEGEHARSDLSPEHIRSDAQASLRRLGLERIPLLQVHWPCEEGTPLEDSLEALVRLQEEGTVEHIGLCNYDMDVVREARRLAPILSLQSPYSLLRREAEELEVPDDLALLAYEPLCRGLLTGRFREPPVFPPDDMRSRDPRFQGDWFRHGAALAADLARVGERLGVTAAAVAVGWVASRPWVTTALVGGRTARQVREVLEARRLLARPRVWSVVERIAALHGGFPPPG